MLMSVTVASVVLAALSTQDPSTDCLAPSEPNVFAGVTDLTPARPSSHAHDRVTAVLFQPAPLAGGVRVQVRVGLTVSMLMPSTVAVVVLPALSTQDPSTAWPAPSCFSVVGSENE